MKHIIRLDVRGMDPAPQGSKTSLGNGRFKESSKYCKPWRALVRKTAIDKKIAYLSDAVTLHCTFIFQRPKSHYRNNQPGPDRYKENAPDLHSSPPDLSKLIRSTEDALTGVAYVDDRKITRVVASKRYAAFGELPGAVIQITQSDAA